MVKKLAVGISFLFHPLLMPTLCILICLNLNSYIIYLIPASLKWIMLGTAFGLTYLLPALSALYLYRKKVLNSIHMETVGERIMPYTIAAFYFGLYYFMLRQFPFSDLFAKAMLGATLSVLFAILITWKWKISIHMIGLGGIIGLIVALSSMYRTEFHALILVSLMVIGITGSARLYLKQHTAMQILSGFGLGLIIELLVMLY